MKQKFSHQAITALLHRRYSCREFDTHQKIAKEDFELILEAGRLAPSSLGLEPWEFVVITAEALKKTIAKDAPSNQAKIEACSHLLVVCSLLPDVLRPESNYFRELYPDGATAAHIAPMLESVRKNRLQDNDLLIHAYAREQCFIAIGQMTQTAAMLDIDSCIIGGFYAAGVQKHLDTYIDAYHFEPVCLIAFGYGRTQPATKHRKPYEKAIKWLH
ncbi:hypothetical protein BKH46_02805 [Helicobacter sp. 12S02634-8]|nr:hypothetical protein BKH46_02805 [Helicobacter sp. 12S02634-8]